MFTSHALPSAIILRSGLRVAAVCLLVGDSGSAFGQTGACCAGNGTCSATTQASCSGSWLGAGTTCSADSCNGTCCNASLGTCTVVALPRCIAPNTWTIGGSCSPNPCPVSGACCNGYCCTRTTHAECTGTAWTSGGLCTLGACGQEANVDCTHAVTLKLGVTALGSNCGGSDTSAPSSTCGTFQFNAWWSFTPTTSGPYKIDTCGSGFNTILSLFSGTCMAATFVDCSTGGSAGNSPCSDGAPNAVLSSESLTGGTTYLVNVNGVSNTSGTISIAVNSVQTGVCCRGATCDGAVGQSGCVASGSAGASFVSSATSCNATGDAKAPCCFADFNKTGGVTVQDIFDFLSAWFAKSPFATVGGDGSGGAPTVQSIFDFLGAWFSKC